MFLKCRNLFLLYIFVLFCFNNELIAKEGGNEPDNPLNAYVKKCKLKRMSPEVIPMCDTLFNEAVQKRDTSTQIIAVCIKLDHYYYRNDKENILKYVDEVKKICRKYGELKYYYFVWGSRLIVYYIKQHQNSTALYETRKMLEQAQADNFMPGIVQCYRAMANIYLTQSNSKLAFEYFQKQIDIIEKNNIEDINLATQYASLAQSAMEMGRLQVAEEALEKALPLASSPYQQFTVKKAYVMYYLQRSEFEKALTTLKEIEELFRTEKELENSYAGLYYIQTAYYQATKQYDKALGIIDIIMNDTMNSSKYLDYSLTLKEGDIYWDMNRKAEAARCYREFIIATDSIRTKDIQNSLTEFSSLLELGQLENEKKELLLNVQQKQLQNILLAFIFSIVLLAVGGIFYFRIYRLNKRLRRSEATITEQNKELKETTVELKKARDYAEEASRMKTTFIQNMSHEVRTPLNSIVGFSQVLTSYFKEDDETREYASIIETSSTNLLRLISDVLDISYLDESEVLPYDKVEDINNSCLVSIERTQLLLKPGVSLLFNPGCRSLNIHTNPERVSQVLTHLLQNAAKFTTEGSITLAYSVSEDNQQIVYTVTDTGTGVPVESQEFIFERFAKLNDFSQGTGLGLSICRIIAEKLGGSLLLDKEYTAGCRFIFILPLIK